jgi:hypothetical protein
LGNRRGDTCKLQAERGGGGSSGDGSSGDGSSGDGSSGDCSSGDGSSGAIATAIYTRLHSLSEQSITRRCGISYGFIR